MRLLDLRSPMLAPTQILKPTAFKYPLMASVKMDGIRAVIINGQLYSRSGKPIPSVTIQEQMLPLVRWCDDRELVLDGELWCNGMTFQQITSIVMSKYAGADSKCQSIMFHTFDALTYDEWTGKHAAAFAKRCMRTFDVPEPGMNVTQWVTNTAEELEAQYALALEEGHEGLMVRSPVGRYKWGRCTIKEANIFKLKNVEETDAVIIGWGERLVMADGVEREQDAFGRDKPVNRQCDLITAGDLGYMLVRDEQGREFRVGSGFTAAERRSIWQDRISLTGRWVKIKSATAGVKDLPRHPVFVSFRDSK